MIIDKPRLDRENVLADEERQIRLVKQLTKMTALLTDTEELALPVKKGDVIEIPVVRKNAGAGREVDILDLLARRAGRTSLDLLERNPGRKSINLLVRRSAR